MDRDPLKEPYACPSCLMKRAWGIFPHDPCTADPRCICKHGLTDLCIGVDLAAGDRDKTVTEVPNGLA
jgi:hypothetical protein